ncbi:MAG: DNA repair protein RecO [Candidatus Omnitrophota bacterium]|nr:DNA repair protein RecO [Candidatus Omnitrophota bacterium]
MSIHKTEAIVINRRDLRETSIIANFYTRDFGKITGILKGIRTEPAKFSSSVGPFSYNEIIFYKKRNSSLHLVSQADLKNNFNNIRQSIFKTGTASLCMELTDSLMPLEDKNEDVFNLILTCLQELDAGADPNKIITIFKIKLLGFSGFKPFLDSCVSCGNRILSQSKFSSVLGGLLCEKCCFKDLSSRSIFRGTVATIMHIEKNDLKNSLNLGMNPQIKKELNLILDSFLNFHLEKKLKSQKVLDKLGLTGSPAHRLTG